MKLHVSQLLSHSNPDETFPVWPEYLSLFLFCLLLIPGHAVHAQVIVPTKVMPTTTTTETTKPVKLTCYEKDLELNKTMTATLNTLIGQWQVYGTRNSRGDSTDTIQQQIADTQQRYQVQQSAYFRNRLACYQQDKKINTTSFSYCAAKFEMIMNDERFTSPQKYFNDNSCNDALRRSAKYNTYTIEPIIDTGFRAYGRPDVIRYGKCLAAWSAIRETCHIFRRHLKEDDCYKAFPSFRNQKYFRDKYQPILSTGDFCEPITKYKLQFPDEIRPEAQRRDGFQGGPSARNE